MISLTSKEYSPQKVFNTIEKFKKFLWSPKLKETLKKPPEIIKSLFETPMVKAPKDYEPLKHPPLPTIKMVTAQVFSGAQKLLETAQFHTWRSEVPFLDENGHITKNKLTSYLKKMSQEDMHSKEFKNIYPKCISPKTALDWDLRKFTENNLDLIKLGDKESYTKDVQSIIETSQSRNQLKKTLEKDHNAIKALLIKDGLIEEAINDTSILLFTHNSSHSPQKKDKASKLENKIFKTLAALQVAAEVYIEKYRAPSREVGSFTLL